MVMSSSAEEPQPLGRVVMAVKDWVGRLGEIWVDAQVIEIKRRGGPTQFLTFRDRIADVSASITVSAMVLDAAGPIPEGSRVTARLRPRVWDRNSSLSFECLELRVAGEGRLLARLEQLKRKLQAEGLFEAHRKRRLPFIPRRIGLITGKDSDAERDVLSNVERRWPAAFTVAHATVQGPNAAESVMLALRRLDADPEVDVIIIARGGGSLEDLLAFSDEGVVRAVAEARTPVVSAIGHEQDVPLLDFVADLRASTPTDAAKHVVPDFQQESDIIAQARLRLDGAVANRIEVAQRWLDDVRTRPVLLDPTTTFGAHSDKLELLRHRLASAIEGRLRAEESDLRSRISSIRAMSPKATLERGYAVLVDAAGHSVSSVRDAEAGTRISAHLSDGQLDLDVVGTYEQENHG
ncbi:exodeoxyribonuclease VII large subunit [Tessaracoccus sp. OS52]|uniref:exodeoxyribonuclease VII large subunit n=1 Tax=Tessaracoccus sp. OS52 TaxID=2886691 RepID=UPI001D11FF0D|nr:exodeoxyribonuclease VII large subunit [Tessaracoccus sp. OS52]MCC2593555.1 exodeoxyribonuclease VII large subunit [Tessaracoccus sp. OS52]